MTTQQSDGKPAITRPRALGFPDLREEMDRLWDALMTPTWRPFHYTARHGVVPAMDVYEKDGHLHIRTELPGLKEEDVKIEIEGDSLTVSGEKKEEHEVKEENYYRAERSYGKFMRQVALPSTADVKAAEAHFKEGVLSIDIPLAKAESKKIEIKPKAGEPKAGEPGPKA